MDTLLSLRVFAEVAESKNFSVVAHRMGLSPAMTSKHVQHVESRVGARLLNRNSRNVSLTEAGAGYLATVRSILEGLDEAEAHLKIDTLAPRGTLRVSMPVWMSNPAFAEILAAYHRDNPDVKLDLDLSGRKISLVDEGLDLALRVGFKLDEGLIARNLGDVTIQMVAAPTFLDHFTRPKTPSDLIDAPMLAYTQIASDGRVKFGGAHGFDVKLRPIMISGNENLLHLSAMAGMGFAMLPDWFVKNDLDNGRLETVLPDVEWPRVQVSAIYANRSFLPTKVRSFIDFLAGPNGFTSMKEK